MDSTADADSMAGIESVEEVQDLPALDTPVDSQTDTQMEIQEIASTLGQMNEIHPDQWDAQDESGRLESLQNVENTAADIQGRPSVPIIAAELSPDTFGGFDGQEIRINTDHLSGNEVPVQEFVDTVIHEGRHAYQQYAVDHPGFVTDENLVNAWAENLKPGNYLTPEMYGQELYMGQPIEADAWAYAGEIASAVYENRRG